jgi:AcrR family transcriptional regulator
MAARVDARIVRSRAALTAALLALAGEKDFAEITVGEIAERAGPCPPRPWGRSSTGW